MTRKEYLLQQKEEKGRKIIGVFPAQYPRELLWAMDIVPAEIWDPPTETGSADAHLQPYICAVVKQGLELILGGKTDFLDGYLFPHTCDSIQNMASVVHDYIGLDKPCFFFNHPRAPYTEASRRYYKQGMLELAEGLGKKFGPLDPAQLQIRVTQGREISRLAAQIYQRRAEGNLPLTNLEFYTALRRGEWLHPDDYVAELKEILASEGPSPNTGPKLIVSGVIPTGDLLTTFDDLGVSLVHDDLLSMSRRLPLDMPEDDSSWSHLDDPWDQLTETYFSLPPCSSKTSPLAERHAYIHNLVQQTGAQGVVFYIIKFCETELFDLPIMVDELKAKGIPTLILETELNLAPSGQISTRVEAFVEMVG